jgi:hypothetical protein
MKARQTVHWVKQGESESVYLEFDSLTALHGQRRALSLSVIWAVGPLERFSFELILPGTFPLTAAGQTSHEINDSYSSRNAPWQRRPGRHVTNHPKLEPVLCVPMLWPHGASG